MSILITGVIDQLWRQIHDVSKEREIKIYAMLSHGNAARPRTDNAMENNIVLTSTVRNEPR